MIVVSTGFVVNPSLYAKILYDPINDFVPVTLVAASPNVIAVNPQVPAKTSAARSAGRRFSGHARHGSRFPCDVDHTRPLHSQLWRMKRCRI